VAVGAEDRLQAARTEIPRDLSSKSEELPSAAFTSAGCRRQPSSHTVSYKSGHWRRDVARLGETSSEGRFLMSCRHD
jgi:hypothetical protein